MKRARRHRQGTLVFIKVHIWLCLLFTGSTLNFRCRSGTYQCNATHFPISTDNRGQTFKASIPRKPPNYVTGEPIKMREKPITAGEGVKRQKARSSTEMRASDLQGAEEESGLWKRDWMAVLVQSHQVLSSSWVTEWASIAGKRLIRRAVFVWIQMFHLLMNTQMHH